MPSHSPIRWQGWPSDEILIIGNDLLCCSFEEEINIKITTCGDVAQNWASVRLISDDWRLCVGISEEYTKEHTLCSDEAEWVNSIGLFSTILCRRFFSTDTMRPHSEGTFSKLEVIHPFTESIDLFGWESHVDLHESVLNYKSLICSVDYGFTGLWTCEREWKWLSLPLKALCFKSILNIFLLFSNNIFWNFKPRSIIIIMIAQREERSGIVRLTKLKADLLDELVVFTHAQFLNVDTYIVTSCIVIIVLAHFLFFRLFIISENSVKAINDRGWCLNFIWIITIVWSRGWRLWTWCGSRSRCIAAGLSASGHRNYDNDCDDHE